MKKIGITGNIGGGKSEVTNYLKAKNYKVLDADKLVAEIYFDSEFIDDMRIAFKTYDIFTNSALDKKKIAKIVFNNSENLELLNLTIAPYIRQTMEAMIKYYSETEAILFLDIPLLFEKNMQSDVDEIIMVHCKDEIRYQRAAMRDKKDIEDIKKIDAFQISQEDKIKLSDYTLYNSGSKEELYLQLEIILRKINDTKVD